MGIALRLGDGLGNAVIKQQTVRQARECVVRSKMSQLSICRLKPFGTISDDPLETFDVTPKCAGILPFAAQCAGTLKNLNRLERLLNDDELVRMPK